LKTHKLIDEIEKLEIENYLNQGENPLATEQASVISSSAAISSRLTNHPRHKLYPILEE